jgi:hypothetical protein
MDHNQDQQQAPPHTPTTPRYRSLETSRDIRLMIQSAVLFHIPYKDIREKLNVNDRQIRWAKKHRSTPQKQGRSSLLRTPQRAELEAWLLESSSYRRVSFSAVPLHLPQLNAGRQAIRTAFKILGYARRTSKKKGFSEDPRVMAERLAFAQNEITWTRERVYRQMFSDEI